jgi:hypothetical protein
MWLGIPFGGRHHLPVHGIALMVKICERDERHLLRLANTHRLESQGFTRIPLEPSRWILRSADK